MQISVKNRSSKPLGHMESYLKSFLPFAQKRMGFNRPPSIFFDSDEENSKNVLGKTAHYNPESMEVVVYVDGRHPKDVIRSLSHELVHHTQNCRGDLNSDIAGETELGYAQNNPHMRNMESEAYEKGNLCMRDWEDSVKVQLQETNYYHTNGDGKQMDNYKHIVETTAKRVAAKIREANAKKIDNNIEEGDAFAPSHYCVHHGGVQHEGKIHMAEAVGHNWSKESNRVTHYDMKLEDGSVLENIAFEDIQVTNASLAEGHGHPMKRDDDDERPDYPDIDGDGDKEESMADAADDKKNMEERKKRDNPRNDKGIPQRLKINEEEHEEEEDVVEEAEEIEAGAEINESNDQWYQRNLFENLTKKWAK
jgi:hypothetical protein